MSLATLANIGGLPGMDLAVTAAVDLLQSIQNIKIYRRQADELGKRCTLLLISYQNACKGLEDTPDFTAAADEITAIIEKANEKTQIWATMGRVKSLVHQSDIKEGIDSLYRDVDTCAHRFNIATHAGLHRNNREMALMRERDAADFRETLQRVLENVEGLREIVSQPDDVQNIVQTIQEELQQPIEVAEERENLRQGLLQIYRQTKVFPPGNDLTGQVEKLSLQPVASGGDNDVHTGMWLGKFKVALKMYRALNRTPSARKRFEREVELWRELQHPHVCRLYGIARFDDVVYSVSSWMENGDALSYINGTIQVIDRMGLLMDVQSGMEYLHLRNIVHGDLRAVNILIDERGRACISDFGLSKVLEDVDRGSIASHHAEGAVRWHARELVTGEDDQSTPISPATDVWSFGMLCLEIMTGERPYAHKRRDAEVIFDLISKRLPPRPTEQVVIQRGLTDDLWQMMLSCWSWDPRNRPDMKSIRSIMQSTMAGMVTPGTHLSESPQPIIGRLPSSQSGYPIQQQRSSPINVRPIRRSSNSTDPIVSNSSLTSRRIVRPSSSPSNTQRPTPSSPISALPSNGGALGLNILPVQPIQQHPVHTMKSTRSFHLASRSSTEVAGPPTVHYVSPSRSATVREEVEDDGILSFYDRINFGDPSDLDTRLALNAPGLLNRDRLLLSPPSEIFNGEQSDGETSGGSVSSSLPSSIGSPLRRTRTPSSSLSMPVGPSVLLNFDGLDAKVVIRRDREGRLLKGTLAGLVDELLVHSQGYSEHQIYQDIFLTSYCLFNPKPEPLRDILRFLLRRHTLAENNPSVLVEERVAIRHEIFGFLRKLLLERHGNAIGFSVLEDLRVFLESITSPSSFAASAKDLSDSIESLIRRRKQVRLRSSTIASLGTRSIRQSEIEPDRLAFAMMLVEGNSYKRITPTDCVLYLMDQDMPTSISDARVLNNKIVNWIKRAILRSDRINDRGDTLRFFINTALECRKLRNFSSMSAILAAINSSAIAGLKKTRDCLKQEALVLEVQEKLSAILDPARNHQAYRELLPSPNHHCVPWLAVHLKDLKSILQKHKGEIVEGGHKLINFERYRILSGKISEMLRYQEKHRDLDSGLINFEPLSYLEEKLGNTSLDSDAEAALEARGVELRTLENGKAIRRDDELVRVGFLAN